MPQSYSPRTIGQKCTSLRLLMPILCCELCPRTPQSKHRGAAQREAALSISESVCSISRDTTFPRQWWMSSSCAFSSDDPWWGDSWAPVLVRPPWWRVGLASLEHALPCLERSRSFRGSPGRHLPSLPLSQTQQQRWSCRGKGPVWCVREGAYWFVEGM